MARSASAERRRRSVVLGSVLGCLLVVSAAASPVASAVQRRVFVDGTVLHVIGDATKSAIEVSRSGSTYRVVDNNRNWEATETGCTGEGTHVATCIPGSENLTLALDAGLDKDTVRIGASFIPSGGFAVPTPVADGGGDDDTVVSDSQGVTLRGGNGNDTLVSGNGTNTLEGGDGEDSLQGGGQDDTLDGGKGADLISGGGENDTVTYAGRAAVTVRLDGLPNDGNNDDEKLIGTERDNVIDTENVIGTSAADTLVGNTSANVLRGGGGADNLEGGNGNGDIASYADHGAGVVVTTAGGTNNGSSVDGPTGQRDQLTGIEGARGGFGADKLIGNPDTNILEGLDGDDVLEPGDADTISNDTIRGGEGSDTVSYATAVHPVVVDFDGVVDDGPDVNGSGIIQSADSIQTTENIIGGPFDDKFTGDANANRFTGNAGNDNLAGLDGDDFYTGGPGNDFVAGGFGVDTVSYADHSAPVTVSTDAVANDGEAGETDDAGGTGVENILGGSGNDVLTGSAVDNKIVGGQGADILRGLDGNDRLQSGEGPFRGILGVILNVPVTDVEVSCGPGPDDTAVRDLLDADANLGAADCENFEDAPVGEQPTVRIANRAGYNARRRVLRFRVRCPRRHKQRVCRGKLTASLGSKGGRRLAARRYRVARKRSRRVSLRLSRREARALRRVRRVRAVATGHDRRGRIKRTTRTYRLRHGRRVKGPSIVL